MTDWYQNMLKEWKENGREDANKGNYDPPFPWSSDPFDEKCDEAYTDGFRERRREIFDKDNDQCQNA